MRTKTLLLTAALSVATAATSMADVFSVNVVGYVNKTIPGGFSLVANPLQGSTNTLSVLIPNPPDFTSVYKFTPAGSFDIYTYISFAGGWNPSGDVTFLPGEGFFILNDSGVTFTNTFVGEVLTGSLSNSIPAGFSIKASKVPQAADVATLGLSVSDFDSVYKWNGTGYDISTYISFAGGWNPSVPSVGVAESVFVFANASGGTWNRVFNPNTP